MRGYRFYEEYDSAAKKRRREGTGNVLALDLQADGRPVAWNASATLGGLTYSATAAVFDHADSGVAGMGVSAEILAKHYRRIPERRAREIHPRLFAWLDTFQDTQETP